MRTPGPFVESAFKRRTGEGPIRRVSHNDRITKDLPHANHICLVVDTVYICTLGNRGRETDHKNEERKINKHIALTMPISLCRQT